MTHKDGSTVHVRDVFYLHYATFIYLFIYYTTIIVNILNTSSGAYGALFPSRRIMTHKMITC